MITKLRTVRREKGILASWLASELGVSRNTLWEWERGSRSTPRAALIAASYLLNVSPDELSSETDE